MIGTFLQQHGSKRNSFLCSWEVAAAFILGLMLSLKSQPGYGHCLEPQCGMTLSECSEIRGPGLCGQVAILEMIITVVCYLSFHKNKAHAMEGQNPKIQIGP